MALKIIPKKIQIDRSKSAIVMVLAGAIVLSVFSLVSASRLWTRASFQRHVVSAQRQAAELLRADLTAANQLITSYTTVFNDSQKATNIIGGKNTQNKKAVPPDGNNANIVLDALPTSYDFPALISSLSQILKDSQINNPNITGTDLSDSTSNAPQADPQPVAIQLSISGNGSIDNVKRLLRTLERSIRPFDVINLQLRGSNNDMSVTIQLQTYFQPAKTLTISSKEVK